MGEAASNYLSLTLVSLFFFAVGAFAVLSVLGSLSLSIANILPIVIALLAAHQLYKAIKKFSGYKSPLGLEALRRARSFVLGKKVTLAVTAAVGAAIWFEASIPDNPVLLALTFFLNPFSQIELNLSGFVGSTIAELAAFGAKVWIVYLVAGAVASLVGKRLNTARR